MRALNKQRINLAALCTGPAIRLLDEALRHATTRKQFGQPIGEFQLVQAMLADCKVEIEAARALILETARKRDRGEDVTMDVSMCKYFASEMCGRVADRVVQIFGGAGYCEDIGGAVPRFYRDVRLFRLYEGTSQIHQLNIAKQLLRAADALKRSNQRRRTYAATSASVPALAAASLAASSAAALAQAYPDKVVRLISPYAPGGSNDLTARIIAQKLGDALGQQVIVENKPGAATQIGTQFVAKSRARRVHAAARCGHAQRRTRSLFAKLPYDTLKDFTPIVLAATVPTFVIVNDSVPARTIA